MRIASPYPRFAATPVVVNRTGTPASAALPDTAFSAQPAKPTASQWVSSAIPAKEVVGAGVIAGALGALTKFLMK
jgi:hypothetical protein